MNIEHPYQTDSAHLWLPQSVPGDTWRRMVLELQMEQVSDFVVPFANLDQPLWGNLKRMSV